jgi:hypothetical protein
MTVKAADDYPFIAERMKQFEDDRKAAQLCTIKDCPLHLHPLIVTSIYFHTRDMQATANDFQTRHSFTEYKEWLRGLTPQQIQAFAKTGYTPTPNIESAGPDTRRLRTENMKVLMARCLLVLDSAEFAAL